MKRHYLQGFTLSLALVCCSFLTHFAPSAFGQASSSGAIQGTVTDATGASIPGAEVTATHTATERSQTVTTSDSGFYTFEGMVAGLYNVSVRKAGFKSFQVEGLKVDPGLRLGYNVGLEVGEITQQIDVQATAVAVQTESGETAGVITGDQIQNLVLNGRNYLSLALLVPGVNSSSSTGGSSTGAGSLSAGADSPLSVNGMGRELNLFTIDGAFNVDSGNFTGQNVTPPLDSIQEFRILKDSYSAKYGMGGSAQIIVETKSGSNDFHGALYEFLRNDALDAKNFFDVGKTPLKQNNFGFSIGGPIRKDKTFFFVNEEWRRNRSGLTLRGAMIPQEMRNGDFTNSPTRPAAGLTFDSVATNHLARLHPSLTCLPTPNQLNPACFDQNAVRLMNQFWPLPNNPEGGFLNYINPGVNKQDARNDTYRVDHYFNKTFSLMGRFMYGTITDLPPALVWGPNPAPTTGQILSRPGTNALLRLTANISPTMINTVSISETHRNFDLADLNAQVPSDVNIKLPFPAGNVHNNIPTIGFARGWSGLGVGSVPIDAIFREIVISDDFSKVKGSHVLQSGAMYLFGLRRQNLFSAEEGSFSFSGIHTGDPVADYLLGLNTAFSQVSGEPNNYFRYRDFEAYLQDDWKVNRRLTLNLGVRYSYQTPSTADDPRDAFSDFDPTKYNRANAPVVLPDGTLLLDANRVPVTATGQPANLLNGVVFPGKDGVPRGIYKAWKKGFGPRFGFAWDLFGDGKSALRGGYGIVYGHTPFAIYQSTGNTPFIGSVTFLNGTLTDPGSGSPGAISASALTMVGPPSVTFKPLSVQTWNLTLERELMPNAVVQMGYVGTGARHVKGFRDINFPLPVAGPSISDSNCLQPGQTIPSSGFDFDPCVNLGLVSQNFTRPFVGWGRIGDGGITNGAVSYDGTSNYHSLQVGFQYRTSALTLNTAYTWGKTLSDAVSRGFDGRNLTATAQDHRNYKAEYGRPGLDRTHIFTVGYIYDIPLLRNRTDVLGKVFGNWKLSGITAIQSGFVFAPGCGTGTCGMAIRPNLVGKVEGPKTIQKWFNTDAFVAPPFGSFGNAGTGLISVPGEQTWNMALFKTIPIRERVKIQFRAEAFNIWNHPNFDAVSTSLGAGNFGQITHAMEPRILEFGLRIDF